MWLVKCAESARTDWSRWVADYGVRQGWNRPSSLASLEKRLSEEAETLVLRDLHGEELVQVRRLRGTTRTARLQQLGNPQGTAELFEIHSRAGADEHAKLTAQYVAETTRGTIHQPSPSECRASGEQAAQRYVPAGLELWWIRLLQLLFSGIAFVALGAGVVFVLEAKGVITPGATRSVPIDTLLLGLLSLLGLGIGCGAVFRLGELARGVELEEQSSGLAGVASVLGTLVFLVGPSTVLCFLAVYTELLEDVTLILSVILIAGLLVLGFRSRLGTLPHPRMGVWGYLLTISLLLTSTILFGVSTWIAGRGWTRLVPDQRIVDPLVVALPDQTLFAATGRSPRTSYLLGSNGEVRAYKQAPGLGTSLVLDSERNRVWMTHATGARVTYFDLTKRIWYEVGSPEGKAFGIAVGPGTMTLAHESGLFWTDPDDPDDTFRRRNAEPPLGPIASREHRWCYIGSQHVWLSTDNGQTFVPLATHNLAEGPARLCALGAQRTYWVGRNGLVRLRENQQVEHDTPCAHPRTLTIHPQRDETVALGCAGGGVWISEDGGQSFQSLGMQGATVVSLLLQPNRRIVVATTAEMVNRGLFAQHW